LVRLAALDTPYRKNRTPFPDSWMREVAMKTLQQRCQPIRLLVLDVDGVLTDGGVVHGTNALEIKSFHVRDGSGLVCWRKTGRRSAVITGRNSPIVDRRASEVGIEFVFQGATDKLPVYNGLLQQSGAAPSEVCYIGDDLADLPMLRQCGLGVAVADACPEMRQEAHYITLAAGGRGAVREVIELILRCQGEWQSFGTR
jgi:3-deoxy-D-manno-octulosonate 8-phosphate phosphatase (KDO 8-P phosphatase)